MLCHRSIKPPVLSALGDMALAMGENFLPVLETVLQILSQAAQLQVEKDNYDTIDYQNELRDGCLEAYTGIIQGFKPPDDNNIITCKISGTKPFACRPGLMCSVCV